MLGQPFNKSDIINKAVTNCRQLVLNLLTTCSLVASRLSNYFFTCKIFKFTKIKEGKEEGEEKVVKRLSKIDVDEDDDDDMDSAELAELVAMASDLTDVTDSESGTETEKLSRSNKTEESSTMTSALTNDSLSVRGKF